MPFLIWGLKSPDEKLGTSQRGHFACTAVENHSLSGPKFVHFTRTIVLTAGHFRIHSWWRHGQIKNKGPQEGISDQKKKNCWFTVNIADERQRHQRLIRVGLAHFELRPSSLTTGSEPIQWPNTHRWGSLLWQQTQIYRHRLPAHVLPLEGTRLHIS